MNLRRVTLRSLADRNQPGNQPRPPVVMSPDRKRMSILALWLRAGFVVLVAMVVHSAPAMTPGPPYRGGIFSLYPRNDPLNDTSELSLPYVGGLSVRFGWADIEKTPGRYDWARLDKAHRIAVESHKMLMVRIIAGSASPPWVYTRGVPKIIFSGSETNWMPGDSLAAMPVPWDHAYLGAWREFIEALGKEISGWDNVYCVQMSGGGFIDEMHLPNQRPETLRQWEDAGVSDEKLFAMWRSIIDAYDKSIRPDVGLSLSLGTPFPRSTVPELVCQYALEHYPGRVWIQQNGLKAARAPNARFAEMIRAASKRTTTGYQMLGGGKFLDLQTGDRRLAFEHAIHDNCSYLEVYKADLLDPRLRDALIFLANGLLTGHER